MSRVQSRAANWRELTDAQLKQASAIANDLHTSGLITDHKRLLTTRHKCFLGREAVDWMLSTGRAATRLEAAKLGKLLIVANYIYALNEGKDFEDKNWLYRFWCDDISTKAKGPSVANLIKDERKSGDSEGPVVQHGWLGIRKGLSSLRAQQRYVVLHRHMQTVLYFFASDLGLTPTGFINFEKSHAVLRYQGNTGFHLKVVSWDESSSTAFSAVCASELILNEWVQAFAEFGVQIVEEDTSVIQRASSIYDFTFTPLMTKEVRALNQFQGKVVVLVNTSFQCRRTAVNFLQLQALYKKYQHLGLEIVGFPCDQFGLQTQGTDEELVASAQEYGLTFTLTSKVCVNGIHTDPLFAYLKMKQPQSSGTFVRWNFTKFLIDRNGQPVKRYEPFEPPFTMEDDIKFLLSQQETRIAPSTGRTVVDAATSPLPKQPSPVAQQSRGFSPGHDPRVARRQKSKDDKSRTPSKDEPETSPLYHRQASDGQLDTIRKESVSKVNKMAVKTSSQPLGLGLPSRPVQPLDMSPGHLDDDPKQRYDEQAVEEACKKAQRMSTFDDDPIFGDLSYDADNALTLATASTAATDQVQSPSQLPSAQLIHEPTPGFAFPASSNNLVKAKPPSTESLAPGLTVTKPPPPPSSGPPPAPETPVMPASAKSRTSQLTLSLSISPLTPDSQVVSPESGPFYSPPPQQSDVTSPTVAFDKCKNDLLTEDPSLGKVPTPKVSPESRGSPLADSQISLSVQKLDSSECSGASSNSAGSLLALSTHGSGDVQHHPVLSPYAQLHALVSSMVVSPDVRIGADSPAKPAMRISEPTTPSRAHSQPIPALPSDGHASESPQLDQTFVVTPARRRNRRTSFPASLHFSTIPATPSKLGTDVEIATSNASIEQTDEALGERAPPQNSQARSPASMPRQASDPCMPSSRCSRIDFDGMSEASFQPSVTSQSVRHKRSLLRTALSAKNTAL